MHPKVLHGLIVKNNAQVFNTFIEFPKPILIAANGPAIGAWWFFWPIESLFSSPYNNPLGGNVLNELTDEDYRVLN